MPVHAFCFKYWPLNYNNEESSYKFLSKFIQWKSICFRGAIIALFKFYVTSRIEEFVVNNNQRLIHFLVSKGYQSELIITSNQLQYFNSSLKRDIFQQKYKIWKLILEPGFRLHFYCEIIGINIKRSFKSRTQLFNRAKIH